MLSFKSKTMIQQLDDEILIHSSSQKSPLIIIFLTVWILGWTGLGKIYLFFIQELIKFESVGTIIVAGLWSSFTLIPILTILWQLFGYETISVKKDLLIINKSILNIGIYKQYKINAIKQMDLTDINKQANYFNEPTSEPDSFYLLRNKYGKIEFNYGKNIIKFANEIQTSDCVDVLQTFHQSPLFKPENFVLPLAKPKF